MWHRSAFVILELSLGLPCPCVICVNTGLCGIYYLLHAVTETVWCLALL